MRGLESESVDLIYLDPPFNSKRIYEGNLDPEMGKQSFKDIWRMSDINEDDLWSLRAFAPKAFNLIEALGESHGESWRAYLTFMAVRIDEMRRILKQTGSVYLHCDWHMNSPLRLLMDVLFGAENYRNEIVWCYSRMAAGNQKQLSRAHDNILFYSKSPREWTFNVDSIRLPYAIGSINRAGYSKRTVGSGILPEGSLCELHPKGKFPEDWINHISFLRGKERTGWATQKPLALLDRIIKTSSNRGELVLDPFCGCATACIAAERLGRQWIGIDQHPAAVKIMEQRIANDTKLAPEWDGVERIDARKAKNLPRRKGVREIDKKDPKVKRAFYERQKEKCAAGKWCFSGGEVDIHLLDYDRKDPGKRGGYYTPDNVQLLCGACNSAKGAKTWTAFIRERKQQIAKGISDDPDIPRF